MSTIQFQWRGVMVEAEFFFQPAEPYIGISSDYIDEISRLSIVGSNIDILEMFDGLYLSNEISALEDLEQHLFEAVGFARDEVHGDE